MDLTKIKYLTSQALLTKSTEYDSSVDKLISAKISSSENSSQITSDWLKWCEKENNRVKVIDCNVPRGILPPGCNAILHDIKVQGKRRAPDDALYNKHADLRENVARGNTILCLRDQETGAETYECMIFALRKFTGGMGDEDEQQPEDNKVWTDYFLKPLDSTAKVICTRKANGEAAHLAIRFIENKFVLCVGSKNVHMLICDKSDIDKYSDGRFQVARAVAAAILNVINDLSEESVEFLCNFMHHLRLTAVFEILNPCTQHVEDLSHLERSELRFISWTSSYEDRKNNAHSYCAVNPQVGIDLAKKIGFKTVRYDIIQPTEVDERMDKIRHDYGYEGEVLYFLDSDENVIGLLKKKTAWYVVARAIREQVANALNDWNKKGSSKYAHAAREERLVKRLKAIKQWLDLSESSLSAWIEIGKGFLAYVIKLAEKSAKDNQVSVESEKCDGVSQKAFSNGDIELRNKFPQHWKTFLQQHQKSDRIMW